MTQQIMLNMSLLALRINMVLCSEILCAESGCINIYESHLFTFVL